MRWTLDMDSSLGQGVLIGSPGNPVKSRALRAERWKRRLSGSSRRL